LDDERAEHVPGCNMAFWRERLLEIGGFDPIYRAAGDDIDVCWRLLDRGYDIRFHPSALIWHRRRDSVSAFWRQQLGYGKAEVLVERNHPDKFNSLGQATWRGVIYGPTSVLWGRGRIYSGRFGEAPFQRLYSGPNHFSSFWALYPILFLLLLALLNPYLLVMPAAGLTTLAGIFVRRGVKVARCERLRPIWRLGPLLGLLHFLPSLARAWGRSSAPWPHIPPSVGPASWPLRSAGGGIFLTEHVEEVGRAALLEGLRHRLQIQRLRPKASSGWDEADIICDSALFWRVRIVSYDARKTLYLRPAYRPRVARLAVPALGIALVLFLYPVAAAEAVVGLVAVVLLEGWIFTRKLRRALMEDSKRSSHA
jgi:hypothetical protein